MRLSGLALLLGASALLVAALADARPGGGEAFSGSTSSRSDLGRTHSSGGRGGGGDIDAGLILQVVILCIRYPQLGIPVAGGLVVYALVKRSLARSFSDWSVGGVPAQVQTAGARMTMRASLSTLGASDPGFSLVLFEDFAYALYAELQVSRARGGIGRMAAFVSPEVAQLLHDGALERVDGLVIGAMRYVSVGTSSERVRVMLEIDANFTEVRQGGAQRFYVRDRVLLMRSSTARSRPPARVRKLDCPNCGAPLEGMRGTTCAYCQTEVGGGRLDWQIETIARVTTESRPPSITTDTPERGTELPTIWTPGSHERLAALTARDPASDPAALWARIGLVFGELQLGWSNRDLARIRPFVTDRLFQYFGYWVDVYSSSGARNVSENARILNIELANVVSDAVYDAVTVRVFATGLDYTLADDGRLLRGSRHKERPYSEYWTLVRGSAARGRPRTELACPVCGGPLRIGMAGQCVHCEARVVSGDFDWVLSRIEQDEAYSG
jgi:predicted lipid-binding transport protein (Tim44 family)